jgi:glycosyltransferase involved in cell wall biosynthesis
VLHVVDSLGAGGAETWLLALLRHWRSLGDPVETTILTTGGEPGVFDEEARALGARRSALRFGRRDFPAFATGFRRLLIDGRYDAIHDHQDFASGWHYLAGRGLLPPVRVTHVHNPAYQIVQNHGVTPARRLAGRLGRRLVARYATHVAATSRSVLADYGFDHPMFARTPKDAVYCGLDPERFRPMPSERGDLRGEFGWADDVAVVLFAGRFDVSPDPGHPRAHKNAGFAVDVAIAAAQANERVRFIFAGEPSAATPILRARIEASRLADRIVFAGVRRDMPRLMAGADALLFPSRAEGLGMVAVEAQATGLPVLASDAVPRECVVAPELVRFLALSAGVPGWRDGLLDVLAAPRPDAGSANRRVATSPFAIAHSAARLSRLYRTGALA